MHVQQKTTHFVRTVLVEVFKEEDQLSEKVGVTQAVKTGQIEVGCEAIVNEAAVEAGEDAEV